MPSHWSNVLGVVFDFDDTLIGDSTTRLLRERGVDPDIFWRDEVPSLVRDGYDPSLAWLKLFLENVGQGKPLGPLSNRDLREFGARLDPDFSVGIPKLFDDLREIVSEYRDLTIEFYIVSGGLEDVIRGSSVVRDHVDDVYGCLLGEDEQTGHVASIKRCISFTEKTRYLFEINKGLQSSDTRENPYLVNRDVPESERRIAFQNMIYVGDGLTDIPCFSLLGKMGGLAFGVFDPAVAKSAKKAFEELLQPGRVISSNAPRYREDDELGALLRSAVAERCSRLVISRQQAYSS
jgi:phosphoserine phosphatase